MRRHLLLLVAVSLCLPYTAFSSDVFNDEPDWTANLGSPPTAIRLSAALLNQDQYPELIVGDRSQETMTVYTNSTLGTFAEGQEYSVNLAWIESADMDSDGDCDIMVRCFYPDSFALFLNDGAGNLEPPLMYAGPGGSPDLSTRFHIRDVNSDGVQDVVVPCSNGYVYALVGSQPLEYSLTSIIYDDAQFLGSCSDDIDNDGDFDIVLLYDGYLSVWLNDAGAFNFQGYYGEFSSNLLGCIAAGNLDSDGNPDLVAAPCDDPTILTLLSSGSGDFAVDESIWIPIGSLFLQADISDYNLDGYNDAFLCGAGGNLLTLGDGMGNLVLDFQYESYTQCFEGAVADFDLDGDIDFATVTDSPITTFRLEVFLNQTVTNGLEEHTESSRQVLSILDNPVNSLGSIRITVPTSSFYTLSVHDMTGRFLSTVVKGTLSAGATELQWNTDHLAPGCYFLRLELGTGESSTDRCVVLD